MFCDADLRLLHVCIQSLPSKLMLVLWIKGCHTHKCSYRAKLLICVAQKINDDMCNIEIIKNYI